MRYDKEQLERFINDTINHREPSEADKQAAADALTYAMSGNDLQAQLGLKRKRGQRKKELDAATTYFGDPRLEIVRQWVSGEIKYKEAKEDLIKDTGMSEDTVKDFMRDAKPRAWKAAVIKEAHRLKTGKDS